MMEFAHKIDSGTRKVPELLLDTGRAIRFLLAHQASKAANARSHWMRWRSLLSRILRRISSSSGTSRSKVMLAGWKCLPSAWVM